MTVYSKLYMYWKQTYSHFYDCNVLLLFPALLHNEQNVIWKKEMSKWIVNGIIWKGVKNFATWTYFVIQKLVKDTLSKRYFNIIYVKALNMIFIDSKVLPSNPIKCMNMKAIMKF